MNEITTPTPTSLQLPERAGAFSSPAAFEVAQRMAKLLTSSSIVPQTYRENLADTVIALEMANRIGANPLAVMQNLYIVHGRPAWSSQFLISCINASGKFSPLRYAMTGHDNSDARACVAWAVDKTGERLEGPPVSIAMAKAEGWYQKNGSKWKTMPELMLRYRAATLFARLYAPELTMGIQCDDEIIDVAPIVTDPVRAAKPVSASTPTIAVAPADPKPAAPKIAAPPKSKPAPEPEPEPPAEPFALDGSAPEPREKFMIALRDAGITKEDALRAIVAMKLAPRNASALLQVPDEALTDIMADWTTFANAVDLLK